MLNKKIVCFLAYYIKYLFYILHILYINISYKILLKKSFQNSKILKDLVLYPLQFIRYPP